MSVQVHISGLEQASRKLRALGDDKQAKRIARKAARKAMNIARNKARENAKLIDDPETAARIFKNIVVQSGRPRGADVVMRLGVRGGASSNQHSKDISGLSGGDTRHWRFVELGTKYEPATPFLRPAFYNSIQAIGNKFCEEFSNEVSKVLSNTR